LLSTVTVFGVLSSGSGNLLDDSAELRGATITLSNFGMIGGRFANLVIVPPQVAIVGAGRISQRVIAHRGQPAVRRALPLSLTFDHRIVTGGEATRFLVALKSDLERIS
jgi:pyruvate dehydrogenase E2 component (dihydrolipoamide acetyltransferase)